MKNLSLITAVVGMTSVSPLLGAIPLNSPTTGWNAMVYSGTSRTDFLNDEQTGINESDLVGSAVGAVPVQTAFYYDFDGVQIGFRVRVDGDSNPPGYTGAIWVGLMLDGNDSVDLFAGVINKGPTSEIGFYDPGAGANVSPSTTSIADGSPIYREAISSSNYLWTPVTVGTNGNDPVAGGTADIGGDGKTDYFATWVLPFSELQAAAASNGFTVTANTPIRFVMGTSEQPNSINQDLNGVSGGTDSTSTFTSLGAVSPVVTANGGLVPEPHTAAYLALGAYGMIWMARRKKTTRA